MPKEVKEIREFVLLARSPNASSVKIKKNKNVVKFKVRSKRYLYTFCVSDPVKVEKLRKSLPPNLDVTVIGQQ